MGTRHFGEWLGESSAGCWVMCEVTRSNRRTLLYGGGFSVGVAFWVKGRFHGPMKVIFFSHRRIYFGRWVSPISVGRRSEIGA